MNPTGSPIKSLSSLATLHHLRNTDLHYLTCFQKDYTLLYIFATFAPKYAETLMIQEAMGEVKFQTV